MSGSRSAGRHRANGSIGAFAVVGPVVGGLTMSALVTGAAVLLAGGSQVDDDSPGQLPRTYSTERTVTSDVPATTSIPGSSATTPSTSSTAGSSATSSGASPTATRRARPTTTPSTTTAGTTTGTTTTTATTDGSSEPCPGNQPEHVRRKVCD
ncbi:MAG: hypothetical protein GEU97_11085 [Actinophytocola sp.]|nr:hypothetical protein [Actinophytocola sp.]